MMHRRKEFLVYPLNYEPGNKFFWFKSKYQAFKFARTLMGGCSVDEEICTHPSRKTGWDSSSTGRVWIIKEQ